MTTSPRTLASFPVSFFATMAELAAKHPEILRLLESLATAALRSRKDPWKALVARFFKEAGLAMGPRFAAELQKFRRVWE
jgi:hypothetical protein